MAKQIPEQDLKAIEEAVAAIPMARASNRSLKSLKTGLPRRTLQYRLKYLVNAKRLVAEGERRWTRYRLPPHEERSEVAAGPGSLKRPRKSLPLSQASLEIQDYLRQPPEARKPVGYNREFLDSYRPNVTAYLSQAERAHLRDVGTPNIVPQAAGTYAKQILTRLLIDLSWNSSRLEGNTYSLLDTKTPDRVRRAARRPRPGRGPDDSQPQGRHRVSGRRGGRYRL